MSKDTSPQPFRMLYDTEWGRNITMGEFIGGSKAPGPSPAIPTTVGGGRYILATGVTTTSPVTYRLSHPIKLSLN